MAAVKIKICGITNLDDALAAVEYGADAIGFVLAPGPRRVTVEKVKEMTGKLPPFVCKVGVFVNSKIEQVRETLSLCNLDLAQLHGDESPEYCASLFPKALKAFHPGNLPHWDKITRYRVAGFMIDKDKRAIPGDVDYSQLWQFARRLGEYGPVILAGGLTSDNVSQAITVARPYAVDVSSGIESAPGKKDYNKLSAFITAVKQGTGGGVDIT